LLDETTSQHGQKTVGLDERKDGIEDLSHENHFNSQLIDRQSERGERNRTCGICGYGELMVFGEKMGEEEEFWVGKLALTKAGIVL